MSIIGGMVAIASLAVVIGLPLVALNSRFGLVRFVEIACWAVVVVAVGAVVVTIAQSLVLNETTVAVPLTVHIPDVKVPGVELVRPNATIMSGGADRATLTIKGLSWEPRIWLAVEVLLQSGVAVVLAMVVKRLATNMKAERPFAGLARPMLISAYVLFVGSVLWSGAGSIGAYMAGREALQLTGWSGPDTVFGGAALDGLDSLSYFGWPEAGELSFSFSFLPFAVSFILALLGIAFRAGERLQADTDGLV